MPFKSESQKRRFAAMVKSGDMKQSVFDEWNDETTGNLPERVGEKKLKKGTLSALGAKLRKAKK